MSARARESLLHATSMQEPAVAKRIKKLNEAQKILERFAESSHSSAASAERESFTLYLREVIELCSSLKEHDESPDPSQHS